MRFREFLPWNKRIKKLEEENERLKKENERLKKEIEELKRGIPGAPKPPPAKVRVERKPGEKRKVK